MIFEYTNTMAVFAQLSQAFAKATSRVLVFKSVVCLGQDLNLRPLALDVGAIITGPPR